MRDIFSIIFLERKALIVAVFVSIIYGFHHFLIPIFLPENLVYRPITISSNVDEGGFYGPRARAVFNGDIIAGDIGRAEATNGPSLLPILNPLIAAAPAFVLNSFERGIIATDFLFPALIFLALYALFCEVLRSRAAALLGSGIFIFSPLLFMALPTSLTGFVDAVSNVFPIFTEPDPLYFSRLEYPKVTFLFWSLALLFLFRTLRRTSWPDAVFGGIFFGVMFYTYLYDWAYFFATLALIVLWYAFKRDKPRLSRLFCIFGIGGVLSLPYWLNFWALLRLPAYADIADRIGREMGREIRFISVWKSYARIIFLAVLVLRFKRTKEDIAAVPLIALLVAYIGAVNVQLVLGWSPQPDHWYRLSFLPVSLAVWFILLKLYRLSGIPSAGRAIARGIAVAFLVILIVSQAIGQYRMSKERASDFALSHGLARSYEWLRTHTPPFSVVASIAKETNQELLLYTKNKTLVVSGGNSLASNDEQFERFRFAGELFGLSHERMASLAEEQNYFLFQDFYKDHAFDSSFYRQILHPVPKAFVAEKLSGYSPIVPLRLPFSVSYLFVGPREETIDFSLKHLSSRLKVVYDSGTVKIYELMPAQ